MDTKEIDLKLCSCGLTPEIQRSRTGYRGGYWDLYMVACIECNIYGEETHYKIDAIKAWNKRTPPPTINLKEEKDDN